ncbi:MAG: CPBP family intramembrane metalloprotease [Clostridia bacterium]|nr:CPBP family intramembrane metalloprotease [Clostridia bacterium]
MKLIDYNGKRATNVPIAFLLCLHFVFMMLQGILLDGIDDPMIRVVASKVLQVLACIIPVALFRYGGGSRAIKRKLRINCMPAFPMYFVSLAVMCAALLLNAKLCEMLNRFGASFSVSDPEMMSGVGGFLFLVFMYVLLPAVCEELFFRYALLSSLGGGLYAVVISALCFSVMHFNLFGTLYTFTAGLVLGCAAIATGSLLLPCILHVSMNSIALFLSYMSVRLDAVTYLQVESILWSVVFLGGIVFAVFTLLNFNRQQNELVNMEKDTDEIPERRNTLTVLIPIVYIVALVIWNLIRMVL